MRSLSERRILFIRRVVLVTIALLLSVGGVSMIILCVVPETKRLLEEAVGIPSFASLSVTAINSLVPAILKILVKLEDYASPAVSLRQTTFRVFALKLVNSLAIFYGLGLIDPKVPCPEKDGGATFMQLLLIDMVTSCLTFFLPKFIKLNCLPKTLYLIKGRKKAKKPKATNKTDPTSPGFVQNLDDPEAAQPPKSPSPTPPPVKLRRAGLKC